MAMGDIAFLLLIFFLILARAQDDSHLKWQPAQDESIKPIGYAKASIVIDNQQKLYLNGQEIGVASLAPALKDMLGDAPAGERKVFVKVHRDAIARRFEPVVEAVSEAGGDIVHVLDKAVEK